MTKELSIESFSPTQIELANLVTNAEDAITKWNPEDELSVDLFKSRKKDLQQARLQIERVGKSMREEALQFQKQVIAHEKSLLETIEPIEDRMKAILDEQKQKEIRAERMAEMPERRAMLAEIGDSTPEPTDDTLLDMDHDQFVAYMNERKAVRFEELQAEARAREAEARRAEEIKQAEERARAEAEARKEREAEEEKARAQKEADERVDSERRAREDAERRLAEAEAARVAEEARKEREAEEARQAEEHRKQEEAKRAEAEKQNEAYQGWLYSHKSYGSPLEDKAFKVVVKDNVAHFYELVDTFTFK